MHLKCKHLRRCPELKNSNLICVTSSGWDLPEGPGALKEPEFETQLWSWNRSFWSCCLFKSQHNLSRLFGFSFKKKKNGVWILCEVSFFFFYLYFGRCIPQLVCIWFVHVFFFSRVFLLSLLAFGQHAGGKDSCHTHLQLRSHASDTELWSFVL